MSEINKEIESEILRRSWFYRFQLPGGEITESYLPEDVLKIHETRAQMMIHVLDGHFEGQWQNLKCIDLACHQGFFSSKLALKNCKEVLGIDARLEHIEDAKLISEAFALKNLKFSVGDIQKLIPQDLGSFDVTLLFGILYHLENPIGVLRLAQAITTRVCLIETQVAPNLTGIIDWGSYKFTKEILGCLAIVDESDELNSGNNEANISTITLLPSLPALMWLLKAVGFKHSEIVKPPPDAYEQIASGKRVVVAAYNDR
jgi:tRNA (mo5U34)-methyltransferase